ncbi:unnamed protein product [Calypogeia fissa]
MDAEVWGKFPDELLPVVLARLPWWKNLQLRGVCKAWRGLLSNPSFLASSSPISTSRPPCVILSTTEECAIVNFAIRRWNVLPQSSFLPGLRAADCFEISAATAGLFLMEGRHESRFLVNPLNKTQRQLPPVPPLEGQIPSWGTSPHHPLKMMVTGKPNNIKIVGVQFQIQSLAVDVRGIEAVADFLLNDSELWSIYVYDLLRDSWDLVSKNLQREISHSLENAIFVGEDLYLLTKQQGGLRPRRHTHSVLKAMATELVEVPIDFTADVPTVHIFQHRGFLMLVCGAEEWNPCVDIWRLENETQQWEKLVSMPERLLNKFYAKLHNGIFNFDAEGDFACFSNYFNTEIVIVYNLVDEVWWEISCKDYISQDLNFHDTFLWQPNLNILL